MRTDELINEIRAKRDYYYNIAKCLQDAANLIEEDYLTVQRDSKEIEEEEK